MINTHKVYVGIAVDIVTAVRLWVINLKGDNKLTDVFTIEWVVPTAKIKYMIAICPSWRYGLIYEPIWYHEWTQ